MKKLVGIVAEQEGGITLLSCNPMTETAVEECFRMGIQEIERRLVSPGGRKRRWGQLSVVTIIKQLRGIQKK